MRIPKAVARPAPTSSPIHGDTPPPRPEQRRGVRAQPEERRVSERYLAGVAARHVPGRGRRAPQQDEDQAVEEEGVAHHDRAERGEREEDDGRPRAPHVPIASAPRWPKSPAGRTTRIPMNSSR